MENLGLENLDLLWITMINYGYIDYTKNFLKSMELSNSNFKLLIYCLDNETLEELKHYKNCICISADIFTKKYKKNFEKKMVIWQEREYKELVFLKLDAILYTLQESRSLNIKSIGYIDTDIVLLSDPTILMISIMKQHPLINVFAQCDEDRLLCSNRFNCPAFCSGVIVFRNIPELDKKFVYNNQHINMCSGDQMFLFYMFKQFNITVLIIDKNVFLNGTYPGIREGTPVKLPKEACLIHFNWLIGDNKKLKMKEQNMWYI
jgi:hypothetical protein